MQSYSWLSTDTYQSNGNLFRVKAEKNPFKWDGSYLGKFHPTYNISQKWKHNHFEYWKIKFHQYRLICIVKKEDHPFSSIYDELMSIFGLPKMGTHYIHHGKSTYILYRLQVSSIYSYHQVLTLSNYNHSDLDQYYKDQISKVYLVRDILGIHRTTDNDIIVRVPNNKNILPYFISLKTTGFRENIFFSGGSDLTQAAKNKWFTYQDQINLKRIYHLLFPMIKNSEDITRYVHNIKPRIDEIIKRIDKRFCYISDLISNRLTDLLMIII